MSTDSFVEEDEKKEWLRHILKFIQIQLVYFIIWIY